ncbi:MAG: LUD domain-containing protein [Mycobacteriales bacterium]
MTTRDDILGRVRTALGAADAAAGADDVPRDYRRGPDLPDLLSTLVERIEDYQATAIRCAQTAAADAIRAALGPAKRILVPVGFPEALASGVIPPDGERSDGVGLSATDLDGWDAALTTCSAAIALTGTIVLDHGPGQGRRALTLVPDRHVCVVRADQVVGGVPEAIGRLDPQRPQTWISGPSATSDIELSRVEGVHGPRQLHVIVIED